MSPHRSFQLHAKCARHNTSTLKAHRLNSVIG